MINSRICEHVYTNLELGEPNPIFKICKKCGRVISECGDEYEPPVPPLRYFACKVRRGIYLYRFVRAFVDREQALRVLKEEGYEVYELYFRPIHGGEQ